MLSDFANWLKSLFTWLVDSIWNVIVDIFNALIVALCALCDGVINLLPTTSTTAPTDPSSINDFIAYLNWFLPIDHILASVVFYCTALALYFSIGPLLRWVKVIS